MLFRNICTVSWSKRAVESLNTPASRSASFHNRMSLVNACRYFLARSLCVDRDGASTTTGSSRVDIYCMQQRSHEDSSVYGIMPNTKACHPVR
eukprot:scaffold15742_cov178-Skeletonema_marinoi.AAC.3